MLIPNIYYKVCHNKSQRNLIHMAKIPLTSLRVKLIKEDVYSVFSSLP